MCFVLKGDKMSTHPKVLKEWSRDGHTSNRYKSECSHMSFKEDERFPHLSLLTSPGSRYSRLQSSVMKGSRSDSMEQESEGSPTCHY